MLLTYKDLKLIQFPAFILPSNNWYSQDGLLFVDGQLVDDKNVNAETLGQRRLQSPFKEFLPLRKSVDSYIGIIKQSTPNFIDNLGRVFIYEKTKFVPLKYLPIKRVDREGTHSILRLRGVPSPFVIPRPPPVDHKFAGVLYFNNSPWLLYDYSITRQKDSRRKI